MDKREPENRTLIFAIIGFIAGVVVTLFLAKNAVNSNNADMMRMMGMHQRNGMMEEHDEDMSMDDMVSKLRGKTGDDFDKAFIELMIEHHEGAIDMANLATSAKHQEIKDLAEDIISAQTKEIQMMRDWAVSWNY